MAALTRAYEHYDAALARKEGVERSRACNKCRKDSCKYWNQPDMCGLPYVRIGHTGRCLDYRVKPGARLR